MRKHLDILNFIGSVSSIAALLIVLFGEVSWLKGLLIVISLVMAFSLTSAIACWLIPIFRILNYSKNPFINICGIIGGSILVVVIASLLFWVTFTIVITVKDLIISLIDSLQLTN